VIFDCGGDWRLAQQRLEGLPSERVTILALGLWHIRTWGLAPGGLYRHSLRETEWEIVGQVGIFKRWKKIDTLTLLWGKSW